MNRTILLAEDEEDDVFFMKHAFTGAGIFNPLQVARDGKQAVNYLAGRGDYADRDRFPLPSLVLLDLKLPQLTGLEVLKWIRQQPELKSLIVIILSSSQQTSDISKAYELGANAYLVKPSNPIDLRRMVAGIKRFWLDSNHSPEMRPLIPETSGMESRK
jgi:CheY-like chemotaxis protein